MMRTSDYGVKFIKGFEGIRLEAYKARPTEEYYTIGYGHYGPDVKKNMLISEKMAEDLLKKDLEKFEGYVRKYVPENKINQDQFDALVSFTYNCGAGNLKKLVSGRTLRQVADAMLLYNKAGGKVYDGLTRRRKAERELFLKGMEEEKKQETSIIIGSARIDENGKALGGNPGDQKQKNAPDYNGEVSMQPFYVSSKGWSILRPKDPDTAMRIAAAMINACNNANIGYDQSRRLEIMQHGTDAKVLCTCDCSSLVRKCVLEASGKDAGNFTTANEKEKLLATGLFKDAGDYVKCMALCTGDIMVTKTKGHTAIVTAGCARNSQNRGLYPRFTGVTTSIVSALQSIGEDNTSFEHRKVIALVNGINDYKGSAAQNTYLLNLLKQGKLIRG